MDINIENFVFSDKGKQRKQCRICKSFEHTAPRCPTVPCSHCNMMGHVYSSCEIVENEKKERKRSKQQQQQQQMSSSSGQIEQQQQQQEQQQQQQQQQPQQQQQQQQQQNSKKCGVCGSFDHGSGTCPNKPCSHCNETGHASSSCVIVKENNRIRNR